MLKNSILFSNKNVCVSTMWYKLDYGTILSSFALYKIIKDLGYEPYLLNKPKEIQNKDLYNTNNIADQFIKNKVNILNACDNYIDNHLYNDKFNKFVVGGNNFCDYSSIIETPTYFFLDFVDKNNLKISYASSFLGKENIPEHITKRRKYFLQRFNSSF